MSAWRLTVPADADIDAIWAWAFGQAASPERADHVVARIVESFERLAEWPHSGRSRPEYGDGVRSAAVAGHVVFYRVGDGDNVDILRVTGAHEDLLG